MSSVETRAKLLLSECGSIPEERKVLLENPAEYIAGRIADGSGVNLVFICTHNSRRSIMAQIWAQTAAEYFSIPGVNCYSGGTEATAFFPTAVNAVRKTGFSIEKKDDSPNPLYLVRYADDKEPIKCFSKVYDDAFNPKDNFAAITVCSAAEKNCPVIFGADARFYLRYEDPKIYDNYDDAESKYIERFDQIGREMLYVFGSVACILSADKL